MTKTHCGRYGQGEYLNDYNIIDNNIDNIDNIDNTDINMDKPQRQDDNNYGKTFYNRCTEYHRYNKDKDNKDNKDVTTKIKYSLKQQRSIKKIVHLIRNPYHNIIARFNLDNDKYTIYSNSNSNSNSNTYTYNTTKKDNNGDNDNGSSAFTQYCTFIDNNNDHIRQQQQQQQHNNSNNSNSNNTDNVVERVEKEFYNSGFGHLSALGISPNNLTTNSSSSSSKDIIIDSSSSFWDDIARHVPCRKHFYLYIQWHNLFYESLQYYPQESESAEKTTTTGEGADGGVVVVSSQQTTKENANATTSSSSSSSSTTTTTLPMLQLPVLNIHYEDYDDNKNEDTVTKILHFLQLNDLDTKKRHKFKARNDYDPFYTNTQKHYIKLFLKSLSSSRVWDDIKHYF